MTELLRRLWRTRGDWGFFALLYPTVAAGLVVLGVRRLARWSPGDAGDPSGLCAPAARHYTIHPTGPQAAPRRRTR